MKFVKSGRIAVILAIALLAASNFSSAQEKNDEDMSSGEVLQLETIVVSASPKDDDQQDIENRKLRSHKVVDLAEILSDELVEVQMIRKSGYGNEVSMRGFGQANMKVLLDGGLIEGACGSRKDPSLSHINMLTVQKITLQQGPFDVTKAGYLGGYVDVISKKPKPGFEGELLGKAGSYGFHSGGFTTSGGNDKAQALIGYNFSESDQYENGAGDKLWTVREGYSAAYNKEGQNLKAFQKNDVWGKLQFTPSGNQTILFEHTYGKAEDILTPRSSFDIEEETSNLTKTSWELRDLGDLSKRLTLSFYRNEVDHLPYQKYRSVSVPKNNIVESVITGGAVQNQTATDFATLTYGIDVYQRDWQGDVYNSLTGVKLNDNLIPSVQTSNLGSYIQMDKNFENWTIGSGLRYDRFQQEADEDLIFSSSVSSENRQVDHLFSGHISVKYFVSDDAKFFGGFGRNYRTPTSTERYIQGNSTYFGNPQLKPTANTEFDLGFSYQPGPWWFQTKVFYSDLEDYIYQEYNHAGYRSYTNIDAHLWGGDIKAGIDLMYALSLEGGVAYQSGRKDSLPDNNNDKDLGQIAPLKGRLALKYNSHRTLRKENRGLFGTVEWIHSAAARDIDASAGEKRLSAWDIMNLRMGYQFNVLTLNIGVDNVFDKEYSVANSYEWDVIGGTGAAPAIINEPGRFLYVSVGYNW